jgi:hypothetical protein
MRKGLYSVGFLIATESNYSSSIEILLDKLWIDFVVYHRSIYYSFGSLGEAQTMHSLLKLCRKHLLSNHIKIAVLYGTSQFRMNELK